MSSPDDRPVDDSVPTAGTDPAGDRGTGLDETLHRLAEGPPIMHDPDPGSIAAGYSDDAVPTDIDDLPDVPDLPPSPELGWQVRG